MTTTLTLTPEQRELARHALGLPRRPRMSCRNRDTVGVLSHAFEAWGPLADAGLATAHPHGFDGGPRHGLVTVRITRAGAEAALERGERLDPEGVPPSAGAAS